MNSNEGSKFKHGDTVVHKIYGRGKTVNWSKPFEVHIIGFDHWTQEPKTVFDVFLNKYRYEDCEFESIALSPLYQALSEDE